MTTHQPNNETPEPMNQERSTPPSHEGDEHKLAGGRMPQKQGPGRTQSDDDMKHKRSGGDVERELPEEEDNENRRSGQHGSQETDEEGGRSRQGGRSRNM